MKALRRHSVTFTLLLGAFGPLGIGPVSDRHGRRPLLLLGCATFAAFGALGAFAQTLPALLLWRLAMGAGAGTVQVLVIATVRDHVSGAEARVHRRRNGRPARHGSRRRDPAARHGCLFSNRERDPLLTHRWSDW